MQFEGSIARNARLDASNFKVRGHFRVLRGRRKTLEAP